MNSQPEQANRLALLDAIHGRKLQAGSIDHRDSAAAQHFQRVVRRDEGGGVFVQADANGERIERQRR